ncbi:MAG: AAA family ATPase [bacterium]|nr:AAA family ATPase [bacterium]
MVVSTAQVTIPRPGTEQLEIHIVAGSPLFVVGANGTGKSSLVHHIYMNHPGISTRLSAHRRTWFPSNAADVTFNQKKQMENQMEREDRRPEARWMDNYESQRATIALFELVSAQQKANDEIADAMRLGDEEKARELSKKSPPVANINDLLARSNLDIKLSILSDGQIMAYKPQGEEYNIAQMSDGERNAVLMSSGVLTAKPGTLFLIDEPERHLHRSIISPLLASLFSARNDCLFVISTHEVTLQGDFPKANTILLSGCQYSQSSTVQWDAELIPGSSPIDEQLKCDILGARRRVLFVEGEKSSLDIQLYSVVFPAVAVIPKGSCFEVERSVKGIRGIPELHWIEAFGIIDGDGRSESDSVSLIGNGIYPLEVHSVESIYYHPEILHRIAERCAGLMGYDPIEAVNHAVDAAFECVRRRIEHFGKKSSERIVRELIDAQIPPVGDLYGVEDIVLQVSIDAIRENIRRDIKAAVERKDLLYVVERHPIRESGALNAIAKALGFNHHRLYENAVLKLLEDDEETLQWVRSLFGDLPAAIGVGKSA